MRRDSHRQSPSGDTASGDTARSRDAHDRAPLVFLPGIGPLRARATGLDALLQRGEIAVLQRLFDVWRIDRPRGLRSGVTVPELAEAVAAAIRARADGPVAVIGTSTGGSVALQLAIDHPRLVERLVLVSAAHRLSDSGRSAQREIAAHLRAGRPRHAAAVLLGSTTTIPSRRRALEAVGFALGRIAVGDADADLIATLEAEDAFDMSGALHLVGVPTLVVGGARDGYYTPELFEQTAARVGDGSVVLLPRRGHVSIHSDPEVGRVVADFLRPGAAPRRPSRGFGTAAPPTGAIV